MIELNQRISYFILVWMKYIIYLDMKVIIYLLQRS